MSRSSYALLSEAVQEAIQKKEIMTDENFDRQEIAYSFWALVHGMAMLQVSYTRQMDIDFPEVDEKVIGKLVHGFTK